MTTQLIRNGKGHRAYRRKQAALKRRTARENLPCGWGNDFGCGNPMDTTLDYTHPRSFTADHPDALANGGHLVNQDLHPFHRKCNRDKGDAATVNGLYKTELIYARPAWPTVTEVEFATMNWVHWWNTERLHEALGYTTPEEMETAYYETRAVAFAPA